MLKLSASKPEITGSLEVVYIMFYPQDLRPF